MSYNSADPKHVAAAQQSAQIAIDEEINDLRDMMSSRTGRRTMWRLLDQCGVFRISFTGNSTTFFNEGQRNVGLKYIALINAFFIDEYVEMVRENVPQGKYP